VLNSDLARRFFEQRIACTSDIERLARMARVLLATGVFNQHVGDAVRKRWRVLLSGIKPTTANLENWAKVACYLLQCARVGYTSQNFPYAAGLLQALRQPQLKAPGLCLRFWAATAYELAGSDGIYGGQATSLRMLETMVHWLQGGVPASSARFGSLTAPLAHPPADLLSVCRLVALLLWPTLQARLSKKADIAVVLQQLHIAAAKIPESLRAASYDQPAATLVSSSNDWMANARQSAERLVNEFEPLRLLLLHQLDQQSLGFAHVDHIILAWKSTS
jgi:hypothetical protein